MALDIATTSAVVFGVVFGLAEVRQAVRDRRDLAAVDIVRTVQTQEVRQTVERVLRLPDDADPELVRGDPDTLDAALAVDSACEMWGSMVFEGVVDQHMLDRMVGGWIRGTWIRLRRWVEAEARREAEPEHRRVVATAVRAASSGSGSRESAGRTHRLSRAAPELTRLVARATRSVRVQEGPSQKQPQKRRRARNLAQSSESQSIGDPWDS